MVPNNKGKRELRFVFLENNMNSCLCFSDYLVISTPEQIDYFLVREFDVVVHPSGPSASVYIISLHGLNRGDKKQVHILWYIEGNELNNENIGSKWTVNKH